MLKDQGFNYVGGDEPEDEIRGFGDKAVRRGFIRKVNFFFIYRYFRNKLRVKVGNFSFMPYL